MSKVDCLLIGGGMAATFLKAKSYEIGQSLFEADSLGTATELIEKTSKSGVRLILPVDVVVADGINSEAKGDIVPVESIPPEKKIVDIGPQTIENFRRELQGSKIVFWNGPVGVEEIPQFAEGTKAVAKLLAALKTTTIIGGGSTAEVVNAMRLADKVTFVSTGGGASLKFLGGEELPGVAALRDKES
jgi:phosphoglycerate kinase